MRTRALVAATLVVVASVSAYGCSSSNNNSKSSKSTTTTTKTYSISTSDGQVSVSLDGKLPEAWPQGFPVPSGAEPAGSGSLAGKTEGVVVGVFTLSGSGQDAYQFYRTNSQLTVEDSSSVGGSKTFVGSVKFRGTYSGSVYIGAVGDTNGLVVILDTGGTTSSAATSSTTTA